MQKLFPKLNKSLHGFSRRRVSFYISFNSPGKALSLHISHRAIFLTFFGTALFFATIFLVWGGYAQKATTKASTVEKQLKEFNARLDYAYNNNPEVRKALDNYAKQARGETAKAEADDGADAGVKEKDPSLEIENKMAWNNLYLKLGNNDPIEGQKKFNTEWADNLKEVFGSLYGDMQGSLATAMELITLRKEKAAKPATTTTTQTTATEDAVASTGETGRGTQTDNPPKKGRNLDENLDIEARKQGFANYEAWQKHYLSIG